MRHRHFALRLCQLLAIAPLTSDESDTSGFGSDFWLSPQISPERGHLIYRTTAKLSRFKPSRRRLSSSSLSFRMPGQDCAVKDLTKTFDLPSGIDN